MEMMHTRDRRNPLKTPARLPGAVQWAVSLGVLLTSTLIGQLFNSLNFTEANIITVVSVLLFNFFFTEPRLICQVIVNLVDNACKYTPPGSVITISAEQVETKVAISVTDNGPGIPDSQKKQVFDMFYTGNTQVADCRRSLGLGLSLCRSIVEAHGGGITLTDNAPSGCNFTFTLPVSEVTFHE